MKQRRRWSSLRRSLREKLSHLTPRVVTEYPFEVLVTSIALLISIPLLAGLAQPGSLVLLLPSAGFIAYGVSLLLGASTIAVSLRHHHPMGLASGLKLLGGAYCIYAVAVVLFAGWSSAWGAFAAFLVLGVISLMRSSHFRRVVDIQMGARRLSRRS